MLEVEPAAPDPTIRVLAAVVERADRYLICQRPLHKRHGGLWEFPGGKCEPGESDADAARREMREELGVTVSEVGGTLMTAHDAGSPYLIAFVAVQFDGEPVCLEHSALAWATPNELVAFDLAPSDQRFVEWLLLQPPNDPAIRQ
ncbi:MAG: (deoxy)nucleoside triphosphate pyrophosphohydrolase [Gemmatimonadaceae bacterium]